MLCNLMKLLSFLSYLQVWSYLLSALVSAGISMLAGARKNAMAVDQLFNASVCVCVCVSKWQTPWCAILMQFNLHFQKKCKLRPNYWCTCAVSSCGPDPGLQSYIYSTNFNNGWCQLEYKTVDCQSPIFILRRCQCTRPLCFREVICFFPWISVLCILYAECPCYPVHNRCWEICSDFLHNFEKDKSYNSLLQCVFF